MRYIDADALKSAVLKQPWKSEAKVSLAVDWILMLIAAAPTADVAPVVRGEWIENPTKDSVLCSYCHADWNLFDNDTYRFCYCPNCGALMEGGGQGDS